jgi:ribosomal protein L11
MTNFVMDVKHIKKCYLMSQKAEAVPPLGTILGNIGVNTIKFCEEFNGYTKELPFYFLLKVTLFIFDNRTFKFSINGPSTGFLLNLLKFEKKIKVKVHNRMHDKVLICILLSDLVKLAIFKFPKIDISKAIPLI